MAISVERDERWGQLGGGLGALLAGIIQGADQKRISRGVAQIDQDPNIKGADKYDAVLKQYGPEGADMYGQLEQARIHQEQLRAVQEERQSEDLAWPAMLQGAPGPVGSTPAGAALGVPQPSGLDRQGLPNYPFRGSAKPSAVDLGLPPVQAPGAQPTAQPAVLRPTSAAAGRSTSGLDPAFDASLDRAISDAAAQGVTLKKGSGRRSYEEQSALYDEYVRRGKRGAPVAPPGTSQHERGMADDLVDAQGRTIKAGSPEDKWLDANEGKYNLARPVRGEPWHIQPAGTSGVAKPDGGFTKTTVRADDLANDAMEGVSALQYGQMRRQQLAQAIEKANPDAPAHVKMMAFERAAKMLAPEERMEWEIEKARLNFDAKLAIAQMQGDVREQLERERANRPQYFITPEGRIVAGRPMTGEAVETQLPPGSTPVGRGAGAAGGGLSVSKSFDVVDEKGKVIRQILAREQKGRPGFVDSQTGEPIKLEPGEHLKQVTPTTSAGGKVGGQVIRQEVGGREVLSDLQNAVSLPVGTTIGKLGTYQPGVSAIGALQGDLARTLTDDDSLLMQASMANMTRELSILTSPVYGGHWAAQQMDPLIPKSGEKLGVVLFKLARLAQTADNALEAMSKAPALSREQQEYAVEMRGAIQKAIPWTPGQAIAFTHKGVPAKMTFGEFVSRQSELGGAGTAPAGPVGQPQEPAGGWPTPNASHVDLLRQNDTPELRQWFDHKFGPGAAERVLK